MYHKKTFLVNFNLEEAASFVDISDDENDELIIEEEGSHDQDDSGVRPLTNLKSAVRRKFTTAPNPQQYICTTIILRMYALRNIYNLPTDMMVDGELMRLYSPLKLLAKGAEIKLAN